MESSEISIHKQEFCINNNFFTIIVSQCPYVRQMSLCIYDKCPCVRQMSLCPTNVLMSDKCPYVRQISFWCLFQYLGECIWFTFIPVGEQNDLRSRSLSEYFKCQIWICCSSRWTRLENDFSKWISTNFGNFLHLTSLSQMLF